MIIPNGEDIVMSREIFEQDPKFFMAWMVGSLTINRTTNQEANRLERVFGRKFIHDILAKEPSTWTWEDYKLVLECCI